jgi:hypothetical protein
VVAAVWHPETLGQALEIEVVAVPVVLYRAKDSKAAAAEVDIR